MEIKIDHITKVYEGAALNAPAVSDVSVRIATGEFFFLLGPSGCGKTTLLRLIAGLLEPTAGRIYFDEKDVTHLSVDKRRTAMVFQGYALWPHMTVSGNVEFGPKMRGIDRKERRLLAGEQLKRVQMNEYAGRKPNQLSGGQQQRVALARALAAGAGCLLLDEPLSNLDARLRLTMREELQHLVKSSGITTIYVTHDQKEALSMADRMAVMKAGKIVQIGTPEALYKRPATRFVADFLGEANFIDGRLATSGPATYIQTPAGVLQYTGAGEPAACPDITCCVRPEQIIIRPVESGPGEGRDNRIPATVVSSMYLGDIRQVTCALGDSRELRWKVTMLSDEDGSYRNGDHVYLHVPAHSIALLPR